MEIFFRIHFRMVIDKQAQYIFLVLKDVHLYVHNFDLRKMQIVFRNRLKSCNQAL